MKILILISIMISLDIAGKCLVNTAFKYTEKYGGEKDETLIISCKKGCFWSAGFSEKGEFQCEKCKLITDKTFCQDPVGKSPWRGYSLEYITEKTVSTCQWTKSGKCKSASCPSMATLHDKNTKERADKYAECVSNDTKDCADDDYLTTCKRGCTDSYEEAEERDECIFDNCYEYTKQFCVEGVKVDCFGEYGHRYDDGGYLPHRYETKFQDARARKVCHTVYGCMYSQSNSRCSYWSVWAFVLTLIIAILVVLAIIAGLVCFLLVKSKVINLPAKEVSPTVEAVPAAEAASSAPVEAPPS